MHRFFITAGNIRSPKQAVLTDEQEIKHLVRVLRSEVGERVELCVDHDRELIGRIELIEPDAVYFLIEEEKTAERESPIHVDLYQGLPKADKMELIVQKTVELGINGVTPIQMSRSVAKISDDKDNAKKTDRWQKIADEAAKQSKRLAKININPCIKFKAMETVVSQYDLFVVPYELERSTGLKPLLEKLESESKATGKAMPSRIGILIGPEGGIDESELEKLMSLGAVPITLGPRILRTETAGIAALTMLQYALGDLGGKA